MMLSALDNHGKLHGTYYYKNLEVGKHTFIVLSYFITYFLAYGRASKGWRDVDMAFQVNLERYRKIAKAYSERQEMQGRVSIPIIYTAPTGKLFRSFIFLGKLDGDYLLSKIRAYDVLAINRIVTIDQDIEIAYKYGYVFSEIDAVSYNYIYDINILHTQLLKKLGQEYIKDPGNPELRKYGRYALEHDLDI